MVLIIKVFLKPEKKHTDINNEKYFVMSYDLLKKNLLKHVVSKTDYA